MIAGVSALKLIANESSNYKRIVEHGFGFNGVKDVIQWIGDLVVILVTSLPLLLRKLWPFILVIQSFIVFLIWNKGIVLGIFNPNVFISQVMFQTIL